MAAILEGAASGVALASLPPTAQHQSCSARGTKTSDKFLHRVGFLQVILCVPPDTRSLSRSAHPDSRRAGVHHHTCPLSRPPRHATPRHATHPSPRHSPQRTGRLSTVPPACAAVTCACLVSVSSAYPGCSNL
ncbi:hypothetical protein E2C01_060505 [Portunus trituberculatus]|uniref:Uncharacterized protein n=1 Tax=Portunus trituberculatus TaxID=210409 RepID=A0A5B7HBL4_PORTR|nr:hypothetical protein [Portunus trituberculatus]